MENLTGLKTIDWQLSLSLANNRTDTASELLAMLIEELPQTRLEINHAYQSGDYEKLQQQVHKLHGATCYCGVPRLKEIAKTLEIKIKKSEENISTLMNLLNEEIEKVLMAYAENQFQNI